MRTTKYLSVDMCRENPDTIYVFGDNLLGVGKGGQAMIRDEPNTFGIPTKRAPGTNKADYFSDKNDEAVAIRKAVNKLLKLSRKNVVVFPEDGLGTGRAKMKEKSPVLFSLMNDMIRNLF